MLAALIAAAAVTTTPAEATRAALADVQTLPAEVQQRTRYVVCDTDAQRIAVLHCLNSACRNRNIVRPPMVGPLMRVDLAELANYREAASYGELHAAWERLATFDPYFHLRTQVAAGGKVSTVTVPGGWTDLSAAEGLAAATGSQGAVLRADFFVGRVAGEDYYRWAGIPETADELLKQIGVDRAVISRLASDTAANLFRSNVTEKPRRIIHCNGPQGPLWITKDVASEDGYGKDPIRAPVNYEQQQFKHDAEEWFYARANGFWGVVVFDTDGKRQDTVPDAVAKDSHALDGVVRPMISCVRCHEREGGGGLQAFRDDQYPLLSGQQAILESYLPVVAQRIGELYQPARLNLAIERGREDNMRAVEAACGCESKEAVAALTDVWTAYVEKPVTLETAAGELGVDVETLVARTVGSNDPIILALRGGTAVNRRPYEASFQELAVRCAK